MELKKISKSEIEQNPQNPRDITEDDLAKLIQSLIDFPEMIFIRPIVMGTNGISLGGNMRLTAISEIRGYTTPVKISTLEEQRELRAEKNPTDEQLAKFEDAINHLLYDDFFFVMDVSYLSEEKQEEFIVKDNVAFGSWNWEAVDSLWGKDKINSWGLEIPKWIGEKEEKNNEKEISEEDVQTAHECPKCGYEFN